MIVFLAGAVEFIANVDADGAPPDLTRVIEGAVGDIVDFLFVAVPAVEVLLHRCAMEDMIERRRCCSAFSMACRMIFGR